MSELKLMISLVLRYTVLEEILQAKEITILPWIL